MAQKKRSHFAHASAVLVVLLEIADVPLIVISLMAALTAILYAAGLWEWCGLFRKPIGKKNITTKPDRLLQATTVTLFCLLSVMSFLYYHRISPNTTNEERELLERYRRTLDLSEIPDKTTLIELNNAELKIKSTKVYGDIKAWNEKYGSRQRKVKAQFDSKELDESKYNNLRHEIRSEASREFNRELRTDARMVLLELRSRIPLEARKHLIGLPDISDGDQTVSMYDMVPPDFIVYWADMMAREIEELTKLLPDRQ